MTEHSHAEHRPPVHQDPSDLEPAPPTTMGNFYPLHDLLAVVDDRATGERAIQALKEAGFAPDDVDLLDGAWFAEAMRGINRHGNLVQRLMALLPTDEKILVQRYVTAAEGGT